MGVLGTLEFESKTEAESEAKNGTELEFRFDQDPEPGERPAPRGRPAGRRNATARDMSAAQVKRLQKAVAEDIAGLLDLGGTLWEVSGDTCCAPTLQRDAPAIGDAIAGCLARNPKLLAKFSQVDFVTATIQFAALGKALKPLAESIWHNHISGAREGGDDEQQTGGVNLGIFPAYSA